MQTFQEFYIETIKDEKLDYKSKAEKLLANIDLFPDDRDELQEYAVQYLFFAQDFEKVIAYCNEHMPSIKKEQPRRQMYGHWTTALEKSNQMEAAIELRKVEMLEFNIGTIYEDVAEVYLETGDKDNAILYFEKHLNEEAGWLETETLEKIATMYEEKGDFNNSGKHLLIAARQECVDYAYLWHNAGRSLAMANKIEEAMQCFKCALMIKPNHALSHYCLGQVYQDKEDKYMAMHHYTEALKINPNMAMVYNNLGAMAFNEDSDIKGAIEKMEEAITMEPNAQLLLTIYINLASLYSKISDYEKHAYYKGKIIEAAGFSSGFDEDEDELDDEE